MDSDNITAGLSVQTVSIAMLVSYDGEPFCGYAKQEGLLTVQGELENALRIIFRRDVPTVCAGRTDAGVHAIGQVVSAELFDRELSDRTLRSLARSINALTHDGVFVKKVVVVPRGFSARFDADWREYRYRLTYGNNRPMLTSPFTWWVKSSRNLDIEAMSLAAKYMEGEHDFKSFCVALSAVGKNTVRRVNSIDVYNESVMGENGIVVRVVGTAFLHSMVRTMVGTLVEVGSGRRDPNWVQNVIEKCDRRAAGPTAPANGLVFWHVEYKGLPNLFADSNQED